MTPKSHGQGGWVSAHQASVPSVVGIPSVGPQGQGLRGTECGVARACLLLTPRSALERLGALESPSWTPCVHMALGAV